MKLSKEITDQKINFFSCDVDDLPVTPNPLEIDSMLLAPQLSLRLIFELA